MTSLPPRLCRIAVVFFCSLAIGVLGCGTPQSSTPQSQLTPGSSDPSQPQLRLTILEMAKLDQAARKGSMSNGGPGVGAVRNLGSIDAINTAELKRIVEQHGWPTRSMVGNDGAEAAWLLVQHADRDVAFQRKCLTLMNAELDRKEVFPPNVAYLTDRVLVNDGRPQLYGTQFQSIGGGIRLRPVLEPEHLEERRAKMGLSSMKKYRELMSM